MAVQTMATDDWGRREALERLVGAQQRRLFAIALSIVRDPGEAEDAVQESFLIAWRRWDTIRDEAKRETWVTTICVHHCLRRRRTLRRWTLGRASDAAAAAEHVRFQGRLLDLDRAQAKLSRQQRAALVLSYHHGYSADQCAVLMGLSGGTVRSHLARALATLRKEMSDD
ncbi:MAG: RNA polymerase sigma factor [Candidatus Dormibacteria bacterium]